MPDVAALAALHAASFTTPRPWSAAEIAALIADPLVFLIAEVAGFALGRAVADQAELLTIAVAPAFRRQGIGARLVSGFLGEAAARGATRAFLEVSADNAAAIAVYDSLGFVAAGRRKGYFVTAGETPKDAIVMTCVLSLPATVKES